MLVIRNLLDKITRCLVQTPILQTGSMAVEIMSGP